MIKIKKEIVLTGLITLIICISQVYGLENYPDLSSNPYIAIDPIGDHAIGDIIFINGSTNFPASRNLTMEIFDAYLNGPTHIKNGGNNFPIGKTISIPYISIISNSSGINRWSVNVSEATNKIDPSTYYVGIWSEINANCTRLDCARLTPSNLSYSATTATLTLYPANSSSAKFNVSPSSEQLSINNTSESANISRKITTNPSVSLPGYLPIIGIFLIVIFFNILKRKN
jgi:hypothetical protein